MEYKLNEKWYQKYILEFKYLVIVLVLLTIFFIKNGTDSCGCSSDQIAELQSTMMYSKEEAIEYCCELKDAVKEYNNR